MARDIATQKLALLIPRLGSPFDGEQLATVAAIKRVLASAGHDLHDLAEAIAKPLPTSPDINISSDEMWHIVSTLGSGADFTLGVILEGGCDRCGSRAGEIRRCGPHLKLSCAGCEAYIKFVARALVDQKLTEYKHRRRTADRPP